MNLNFPILGILNKGWHSTQLEFSASLIGINVEIFTGDVQDSSILEKFVKRCDLITKMGEEVSDSLLRNLIAKGHRVRPSPEIQSFGDPASADVQILVARSPHGQAATWSPMEMIYYGEGIMLSTVKSDSHVFQRFALDVAKNVNLVGVALVGVKRVGSDIAIHSLNVGPTIWAAWCNSGARTNQYEQHIRALFDLPLGDTRLTSPSVVAGYFSAEPNGNLFRPYLHLMARNPELKFEQFGYELEGFQGSVMVQGEGLLDLRLTIEHALDFMNGVIDE